MWALVEDLNVFYIFPSLVRILAIDLRADGDIEVLRRKLRIPTSFYIPHTHRRVGWRSRSCRIGQIFKDWEHRFGVRITGFRLSPDPRCSQRFPSRLDPIIVLRAKAILKCTLATITLCYPDLRRDCLSSVTARRLKDFPSRLNRCSLKLKRQHFRPKICSNI